MPLGVSADLGLSDAAVRLFAVISAHKFKGTSLSVGQRLLGEILGWHQSKVSRVLKQLVAGGHLIQNGLNGRRSVYSLPGLKGPMQVDASLSCVECKRICRNLASSGYCRTCVRFIEDLRRYKEALAVIGRDATPEQVAQHLHLEKITKRWRKIARRVSDLRAACA